MSRQEIKKRSKKRTFLLNEADFVNINVSGIRYETLKSTLERFPLTLLGNYERRKRYYVPSRNCYFFDRNCQSFESILYYYQSGGILIRPETVPMFIFNAEVEFFDLGQDTLNALLGKERYSFTSKEVALLPKNKWQRGVWQLFEEPDSSTAARCIACFSIAVIATSIILFCMETMPMFQVQQGLEGEGAQPANNTNSELYDEHGHKETTAQAWFVLELCCIGWFTLEYVVRFASSPHKWIFFTSFLNVVDLLAILPYFIILSVSAGHKSPMLRVIRLVRVFRVFKLSRHSNGLQVLGYTLRASISELCMLMFFLLIAVILFSSAIYYAEHGENRGEFESIPDAFWYSLVTMSTVGYGDKAPKTFLGKVIGSLCAVSGVLTIALPVPVIVSNFEYFYKMERLEDKENMHQHLIADKEDYGVEDDEFKDTTPYEEKQLSEP